VLHLVREILPSLIRTSVNSDGVPGQTTSLITMYIEFAPFWDEQQKTQMKGARQGGVNRAPSVSTRAEQLRQAALLIVGTVYINIRRYPREEKK